MIVYVHDGGVILPADETMTADDVSIQVLYDDRRYVCRPISLFIKHHTILLKLMFNFIRVC